jgi:hypothetical protein
MYKEQHFINCVYYLNMILYHSYEISHVIYAKICVSMKLNYNPSSVKYVLHCHNEIVCNFL